jgi:hypothetical protein
MLSLWKNAEKGAGLWLESAVLGKANELRVCAFAGHGFVNLFKADLPWFIIAAVAATPVLYCAVLACRHYVPFERPYLTLRSDTSRFESDTLGRIATAPAVASVLCC